MSRLFALITPLPIFKICLLLMSPPACWIPVAMFLTFRIRWSSKIFGLPTFFQNNITIPDPVKFILPTFTDVLIRLCLGYFNENVLMAEEVPNIKACFPTSLFTFSGICFWYCLGQLRDFFYLVCCETQFRICDVFRDTGNNICDCISSLSS